MERSRAARSDGASPWSTTRSPPSATVPPEHDPRRDRRNDLVQRARLRSLHARAGVCAGEATLGVLVYTGARSERRSSFARRVPARGARATDAAHGHRSGGGRGEPFARRHALAVGRSRSGEVRSVLLPRGLFVLPAAAG